MPKMLLQHTSDLRTAMQLANRSAEQHASRYITQMHLLVGLASAPGSASKSLSACGVDLDDLQRRALELRAETRIQVNDTVGIAIQEVERLNHNQLDGGHLLLAMISDRDDCARMLKAMGVNLDELGAEIERRLPQPTFPLQQALATFADDSRIQKLRENIDDAQQQIESNIAQADFETAAFHRDKKDEITRELVALLEHLWHESQP